MSEPHDFEPDDFRDSGREDDEERRAAAKAGVIVFALGILTCCLAAVSIAALLVFALRAL